MVGPPPFLQRHLRRQHAKNVSKKARTDLEEILQTFTDILTFKLILAFPGHYSYECKVSNAERPYKPRPSRTQQLFDPAARQRLTMASPPEETKHDLTRK